MTEHFEITATMLNSIAIMVLAIAVMIIAWSRKK